MTDASMSPWREAGGLVYAAKERLYSGDFAILAVIAPTQGLTYIAGRLVSISPLLVTMQHLRPAREIRICRRRIVRMLRAVTLDQMARA